MEEIALKDLDPRLIKQIEDARKTLDRNPAHAASVLEGIVLRNPGCLDARRVLRQAQNRAAGSKGKGLGKLFGSVTNLSLTMGSAKKIQKDPKGVLEAAEKALSANPANSAAHKLLAQAAEALGLRETAIFAYESIRKIEPANTENAKALMQAYIDNGQSDAAVKVGDATLRVNSSDEGVQQLIRKASVQQSINKGGWDEDKDFRSKLKNEDEAVKLEQASRAKTDDAGLQSLVDAALERIEAEPENVNNYRDAANNYRKLGEYDKALEMLNRASETEGGKADTTMERLVIQISREKMVKAIAAKEAEVEADPENAALAEELNKLKAEERAYRREQAKSLVQRYPNEYGYRYELGELYFEDGDMDNAIKEFQMAQRNPKVRINALIYLGKAYKQKGFFDLAAEQLAAAKSEIPSVTEQKKDVIYELGECYENQNDMEKAMVEYKTLYGMDIAFRDVSEKIDKFYKQKSGNA